MRPGDRRDGQPLIFGWGRHLTRAEKQRYRERFVLGAGIFVFALVVLVIGAGLLQQFVLKPRAAVATVNGESIERQWYDKNLAYNQFVLQQESDNIRTQYQAIVANTQANAAATATANPSPAASASPAATPPPAAGAEASGTAGPTGTPTFTPTPSPTFNPQETATVGALTNQYVADQTQLQAVQQQTLEDLIDADLMRQNAGRFGITVSNDDVAAQAKKTTDRIGGDNGLKQLFSTAHLSQGDFDQIQYNLVLKSKFEAYFADHPDQAPTPSPTPVPTATPESTPVAGPQPPTPVPTPTPIPTPGADTLDRWLQQVKTASNITRAPFPLPSD